MGRSERAKSVVKQEEMISKIDARGFTWSGREWVLRDVDFDISTDRIAGIFDAMQDKINELVTEVNELKQIVEDKTNER